MMISAYALKSGDEQKDRFYENFLQTTSITDDNNFVSVVPDFNRHVAQQHPAYFDLYGSYSYGTRNEEVSRLLLSCNANCQTQHKLPETGQSPQCLPCRLTFQLNRLLIYQETR